MEVLLKILILTILSFNFVNLEEDNVFPLCSRKYPDIGECIQNALNKLRKTGNLANGKIGPNFDIPPLDPFILSHYELGDGLFKVTFSDVHLIGTTNFRLAGIKAYFDGPFLKFMPHVELDRLDVKAKYSLNNLLPFPQTGQFSLTLSDMKVHGNGRVRIYKKNGIEYFKIEQAKLMFESIKLSNLKFSFPVGRTRDAALLNTFLRLFGEPLSKLLYKILEQRIDELHLDVANGFVEDIPVSYFFSE